VVSVQQLNEAALRRLAPAITTLARAEGLEAHARSVEVRIGNGTADPLVRDRLPGLKKGNILPRRRRPARGPTADRGVHPTGRRAVNAG